MLSSFSANVYDLVFNTLVDLNKLARETPRFRIRERKRDNERVLAEIKSRVGQIRETESRVE